MKVEKQRVVVGPGFLGLLALVFITLKLVGVINWAWWIVLSPIWVPLSLVVLFWIIIFIILWFAEK